MLGLFPWAIATVPFTPCTMATRPKPNWKRIALGILLVFPVGLLANFGLFHLKHHALIWANGGRWCADLDEASGDVLDFEYGDSVCNGEEILEQI